MGEKTVSTRSAGQESERLARQFLEKKGFRILATNCRTRGGELDIVAEAGRLLIFVEVRSLHSSDRHLPEETITLPKQLRLSRAAMAYIQRHGLEERPARFDVVSVESVAGRASCRHIEDAFELVGF
jgi:putative endonuclease